MGTRSSRHNKGRKPVYKEYRHGLIDTDEVVLERHAFEAPPTTKNGKPLYKIATKFNGRLARLRGPQESFEGMTAREILARPKSGHYWTRTWWSDNDLTALKTLADSGSEIAPSALALGRAERTIVHKASDIGLHLPPAWSKLIRPLYVPHPREQKIILAYPFIVKARPQDADLLRANALVPRGFPDHMRADICQSVMLALYEGEITLDELEKNKASVRWFIKKFYRDQMPHQETRIEPLINDNRSYDEVASALSFQDWDWERMNDRRTGYDALHTHAPAHQIEDVYQKEVSRAHSASHERGEHLTREEIAESLTGAA